MKPHRLIVRSRISNLEWLTFDEMQPYQIYLNRWSMLHMLIFRSRAHGSISAISRYLRTGEVVTSHDIPRGDIRQVLPTLVIL